VQAEAGEGVDEEDERLDLAGGEFFEDQGDPALVGVESVLTPHGGSRACTCTVEDTTSTRSPTSTSSTATPTVARAPRIGVRLRSWHGGQGRGWGRLSLRSVPGEHTQ
jgi:hypothetical protein